MKQGYLFRFILFVVALLGYLYLFDPSFTRFLTSVTEVINLNFADRHLLNVAIWLLGFWGILVYLNVDKKFFRISVWVVFILASFINFLSLQLLEASISISNIAKLETAFNTIGSIPLMELLKFIFFSIALVALSIAIKPLTIHINTWLPAILGVVVLAAMLIFNEKDLVLQSVYLVPGVILHKYLLVGFDWLKKNY